MEINWILHPFGVIFQAVASHTVISAFSAKLQISTIGTTFSSKFSFPIWLGTPEQNGLIIFGTSSLPITQASVTEQ